MPVYGYIRVSKPHTESAALITTAAFTMQLSDFAESEMPSHWTARRSLSAA
jgi:hypothetical protein